MDINFSRAVCIGLFASLLPASSFATPLKDAAQELSKAHALLESGEVDVAAEAYQAIADADLNDIVKAAAEFGIFVSLLRGISDEPTPKEVQILTLQQRTVRQNYEAGLYAGAHVLQALVLSADTLGYEEQAQNLRIELQDLEPIYASLPLAAKLAKSNVDDETSGGSSSHSVPVQKYTNPKTARSLVTLNVRDAPGGNKVGSLQKGVSVVVLGEVLGDSRSHWRLIEFDGRERFVSAGRSTDKYLEETTSSGPTTLVSDNKKSGTTPTTSRQKPRKLGRIEAFEILELTSDKKIFGPGGSIIFTLRVGDRVVAVGESRKNDAGDIEQRVLLPDHDLRVFVEEGILTQTKNSDRDVQSDYGCDDLSKEVLLSSAKENFLYEYAIPFRGCGKPLEIAESSSEPGRYFYLDKGARFSCGEEEAPMFFVKICVKNKIDPFALIRKDAPSKPLTLNRE